MKLLAMEKFQGIVVTTYFARQMFFALLIKKKGTAKHGKKNKKD